MPIRVQMTIPRPAMEAAVEGLAAINWSILRCLLDGGVYVPRLYEAGIRYRDPGKLRWHTLADVYDLRKGDCKDLVAVRLAELRHYEGEPAIAHVYETRRRGQWHAVVKRADGTIEDPSKILIDAERNGR